MKDFIYHALGICGEHYHPNLLNLSLISLIIFSITKLIINKLKTENE
jgi:hypothetical protein